VEGPEVKLQYYQKKKKKKRKNPTTSKTKEKLTVHQRIHTGRNTKTVSAREPSFVDYGLSFHPRWKDLW
jgi:hypothetical protein